MDSVLRHGQRGHARRGGRPRAAVRWCGGGLCRQGEHRPTHRRPRRKGGERQARRQGRQSRLETAPLSLGGCSSALARLASLKGQGAPLRTLERSLGRSVSRHRKLHRAASGEGRPQVSLRCAAHLKTLRPGEACPTLKPQQACAQKAAASMLRHAVSTSAWRTRVSLLVESKQPGAHWVASALGGAQGLAARRHPRD